MNMAEDVLPVATAIDLRELLADRLVLPALRVTGLCADSRQLRPGEAFVALRGASGHGLQYASAAVAAGARAVLYDPATVPAGPPLPAGVLALPVPRLEPDLGALADRAYGEPSRRVPVVGVTGTNGKTTCAWLYAAAMSAAGRRGAYLGTLGAGFPPAVSAGTLTTPDCLAVHARLRELVDEGAGGIAMEISSHALVQGRIAGVRLQVAAFTNLSRDHLDYHGSMDEYGAAKARLFAVPGLREAVINAADPFGARLIGRLPGSLACTEVQGQAHRDAHYVAAHEIRATRAGLTIRGRSHLGEFTLHSRLLGEFNAENLLVVMGLLLATGLPLARASAALEAAGPPPGRMETFALANGAQAIVDYAHTPDALDKLLRAARKHCAARLWCVFGCGGDRDAGKRPDMGRIAEQLADEIVLTDDNPRSEPPAAIVAGIVAGMRDRARARIEHDRAAAIALACGAARAGDVVVIAGKGHEDYQIIAGQRRAFSDRATVASLAGRLP
jgi:UDP-N-acetylmuramoyl-L-alanyl-D-glutamate--2,6-diaminopimelate ligase